MQVYLLAKTEFVNDAVRDFYLDEGIENGVDFEPRPLKSAQNLTEFAGRLCYMSFENPRPGGQEAYIENLKVKGHGSVAEHASFTFLVTGVSRSLTHELVRHRSGFAFSQESQRYVDARQAYFICPPAILADSGLFAKWDQATTTAQRAYDEIERTLRDRMDKKESRQAARSVMPNATTTRIVFTANIRALRHFIETRGSAAADAEICFLAGDIYDICIRHAPLWFNDYQIKELGDGRREFITEYRKI